VLSRSIPLFFISPDSDGFWIACESDFRIGGIFLFQSSAMRFAQRHSAPNRCATMILEEPHNLTIENRGNRLVGWLRPALRQVRRVVSKARSAAARVSRAHIEERLLRAALEAELYRGRYKHSNKNDDDIPIVRETCMLAGQEHSPAGEKTSIVSILIAFTIFTLILIAIIALHVAVWFPRFQQ